MQGIMRRVPKMDCGSLAGNPATWSTLNAAIFGPHIRFLADSQKWQVSDAG